MNYLLDTNVVSEWARLKPDPAVIDWLASIDEDRTFLSVITIGELERGIELLSAGKKRERLASWLATDFLERFEGRLLPITTDVAREWGRLSASRQRAGRPLGPSDGLIAATSRAHDLTLVSRNDDDFDGCGIHVFNPWSSSPPLE